MNKFIGIGRLTKDPELRYTNSQVAVVTLDLAINRKYTNNDGTNTADFFRVIAWRKTAENVKKYCKKGDLIAIEGEVQNRQYEDKGEKKYITEIVASSIQFLQAKNREEESTNKNDNNITNNANQLDVSSIGTSDEDFYSTFGDIVEENEAF